MSARPNPALPSTALRRWRELSGVSYAELARRVGISRRQMLRIAAGELPSSETARAIRRVTGVCLNELIGDALPSEPRNVRAVVLILAKAERERRGRSDL